MSHIVKLITHPYINPKFMSVKIKNIWCCIGCVCTSIITMNHIINENEKSKKYFEKL